MRTSFSRVNQHHFAGKRDSGRLSTTSLSGNRALDLRTRTGMCTRFCACSKKKDTPESFILLFLTKKVSTIIYTDGG